MTHRNPLMDRLITSFPQEVEAVRASGCGNKMLGIVTRNSDCHIYSTGGASRWDIGPGTVMIRALGGHVSGIRGEQYEYFNEGD